MAVDLSNTKAIVLDIEGTTTSISFVKDTLYPYARANLEEFLTSKWDTLTEARQLLKDQAKKDIEDKVEGAFQIEDGDGEKGTIIKSVLWQMDNDKKTAALKNLQGLIWQRGYDEGVIKGHVYSDVADALRDWKAASRSLYIYSSGSVDAQKLLFKHSTSGDLLDLFAGHFDCNIGPKIAKESYEKIIAEIGKAAEEILFLTDVAKEAEAAKSAGMQVALVLREGNAPLSTEESSMCPTIESFSEVLVQPCAKRVKREESQDTNNEVVAAPAPEPEEKMEVAVEVTKEETETMETEVAEPAKEAEKPEEVKETVMEESKEVTTDAVVAEAEHEKESVPKVSEVAETSEGKKESEVVNGDAKPVETTEECVAEKKDTEAVEVSETKKEEVSENGQAESKPEEVNGKVEEVNGKVPEEEIKAEETEEEKVNDEATEPEKQSNGTVTEAEVSKETNGNGKAEENGVEGTNGSNTNGSEEKNCNGDAIAKKKEALANGAEEIKAKTVETAAPAAEVAAE